MIEVMVVSCLTSCRCKLLLLVAIDSEKVVGLRFSLRQGINDVKMLSSKLEQFFHLILENGLNANTLRHGLPESHDSSCWNVSAAGW